MDALDENRSYSHRPWGKIRGEENIEADEREGNGDFVKRSESLEKELGRNKSEEENKDQCKQSEIEENIARMWILNERRSEDNYDSRQFEQPAYPQTQNLPQQPNQEFYESNMNPLQTPGLRVDESYQNIEEYNSQIQQFNIEDQQDSSQNAKIAQYEAVLQSVNSEFQKLLNKNKQTEEELSISRMKLEQAQIALEQESTNLAAKINDEKRMQLLQFEK